MTKTFGDAFDEINPTIRMYGVTAEGYSVCAHVHGFLPYFYIHAPRGFTANTCNDFANHLNVLFGARTVHNAQVVSKKSLMGYAGQENVAFIKLTISDTHQVRPQLPISPVAPCEKCHQNEIRIPRRLTLKERPFFAWLAPQHLRQYLDFLLCCFGHHAHVFRLSRENLGKGLAEGFRPCLDEILPPSRIQNIGHLWHDEVAAL